MEFNLSLIFMQILVYLYSLLIVTACRLNCWQLRILLVPTLMAPRILMQSSLVLPPSFLYYPFSFTSHSHSIYMYLALMYVTTFAIIIKIYFFRLLKTAIRVHWKGRFCITIVCIFPLGISVSILTYSLNKWRLVVYYSILLPFTITILVMYSSVSINFIDRWLFLLEI